MSEPHTSQTFESSGSVVRSRLAHIACDDEPVRFGVHSEVAEHYGVDPDRFPPEPTMLDYVVAAAAG